MYGQSNYGPPFGPGSQPPRTSYQQNPPPQPPPPPPPPPNLHFQQRPQAPLNQLPPHIGQPGPRLYQHQHGVPSSFPLRAPNGNESYRHLPPMVQFGGSNPATVPPSQALHRPEMVRALPPPPPRVQGQMFYPMPPYSGTVESVGQNPPPPPPTASSSGFSAPMAYNHASAGAPPLPPIHSETESRTSITQLQPIEPKAVQGIEDLSTSAGDSDMEMEDDITLTDKDENVGFSSEGLLKAEEIDGDEQSNAPQLSRENVLLPDTPSELSNPHLQSEDLTLKVDMKVSSEVVDKVDAADCTSEDNLGKTVSLTADKLSPLSTSLAAETITSKDHSKITESGDPIKLLQDYASDDNAESDDEILYKEMNLSHLKPLTSLAGTPNKDTRSKSRLSKSSTNHNAANRAADMCQENNHGDKKDVKDATSHLDFRNKSSLDDGGACDISKTEDKPVKSVSASLKVDEFGRLVREGSVDSDSDHGYAIRRERRAKRDRSRSRSRSRSPLERRSRRRKNMRSRSRSRSPRNRRSRSRSPIHRRLDEFSGVRNRSNGGRAGECFDFRKGKCFRGASCRFTHHEVGKSNSSRRYRGEQKNPENNNTKKESRNISVKLPDYVHDQDQTQEIEDSRVDRKREDINMDSRRGNSLDHIGESIDSGSFRKESDTVREMKTTLDKSTKPNLPSLDDRTFSVKSREPSSINNFPSQTVNSTKILISQGDTSVTEDQNTECMSRQRDGNSVSDALPNQNTNSPKNLSDRLPVQNIIVPTGSFSLPNASSSQSLPSEAVPMQYTAANELPSSRDTAPSIIPHEISPLPPPPPPPPSFPPPHGANVPHRPHLPLGYSSVPLVAPVPVQSSYTVNSHTHQASLANQNPQFWTLPPPPPRPPLEFPTPSVSSHFQQSHFLPRNESHIGSQVTGFLPHSQPSIQELNTSTSLGLGSLHQQPVTSQELYANRTLHSNLPSGQLSQSLSEIHPFSHMQTATSHLKFHVGDGNVGLPGKIGYRMKDLSDDQDKNQSSLGPDFGLPRIVPHHNPYASTFEQPLGSKLTYASLSVNQNPVTVDEKIMTSTGGDQYDPLLDSVEPKASARKKDRRVRKWEPANDSDQIEKSSDLHKPVDLDENLMASLDNDDFGETADAEIGAVENESPSDHVGVASGEERETDTKSTGKKKKKRDSRSTKPFKMAIADFVKDVLKPSWRQGNMSKEAFKTIVKKTVDKVSGAMKGHNVPKSQAKIDQYIDSSQRKLTKLVMGYVDKYVKV